MLFSSKFISHFIKVAFCFIINRGNMRQKYGSAATFYFIARHDLPVIVREFKNFLDKGVLKCFIKESRTIL